MVRGDAETEVQSKRTTAELRKHLLLLEKDKAAVVDPGSDKLTEYFDENDRLHEAATLIVQQGLVTSSFLELSQAAKVQSGKLQASLKDFSPSSFVNQLSMEMVPMGDTLLEEGDSRGTQAEECPAFDFEKFGDRFWKKFRFAPRIDFMYGLQELQPKGTRRKPSSSRQNRPTEVAKPVAVTDADGTSKTKADKHIERMWQELRNKERIELDDFAVSSDDYAKTIENLFYTAFLVKDGRAKVKATQDQVVIQSLRRDPASEEQNSVGESRQVILRFDYARWLDSTKRVDAQPSSRQQGKKRPGRVETDEEVPLPSQKRGRGSRERGPD